MRWLVGAFALALAAVTLLSFDERERCIAAWSSPLEGRTRSQRHNAALALARVNGAIVQPGEVFSFNQRVGSYSVDQGYRPAPVSYNGQLVTAWGGGVCQASTTVYNAALLAGMEILERHPHRFAPSYVPPGRDAAVAYDAFDLKFRNPLDVPVRIHCSVERGQAIVRLYAAGGSIPEVRVWQDVRRVVPPGRLEMGEGGRYGRLRTQGAAGFDVVVYRRVNGETEMISKNFYPALNEIVERTD
ncbi:MAG: hypothetical protein KatS3mg015_1292 [Fimbriimonadales bacterium]|nr:MAG: hypothetical protein KatS3mg015_1292 [Fimbriimonadales bacterium]